MERRHPRAQVLASASLAAERSAPRSRSRLPADRSWLSRWIDRCFTCSSVGLAPSSHPSAAGNGAPARLSPLPGGGGGVGSLGGLAATGPQRSKEGSADVGFMFQNDSVLLSQDMSQLAQLSVPALSQPLAATATQATRLSNNTSGEGGQSGGGDEAHDQFVVDGLAGLSDWEIRPEGEQLWEGG